MASVGEPREYVRPAKWHIGVLDGVEGAPSQIVELRQGRPGVEYADDAKCPIVPANRLTGAVGSAEEFVVQSFAEHDQRLMFPIRVCGPTGAVEKRDIEHGKESPSGRARRDRNGPRIGSSAA